MLCRVVGGIQAIGLFIGTFSLCAIAIDRYFRLVIAPGSSFLEVHATLLLHFIRACNGYFGLCRQPSTQY